MKTIFTIKISRRLFIFLTSLLCGVVACTERFIDVESNVQTSEELNRVDPVELVNAVYNQLLSWDVNSFAWVGISDITSDDADKGSAAGDTGSDKDILDNLKDINPNIGSVISVWVGHFEGIQRANQVLNRLPTLTIDDAYKNRLTGEAKFLRALFYFRLVQVFGPIPIVLGEVPDINTPAESIFKRPTKEDMYAFIEKDLQDAIQFLPEKSGYDDANLGRASKGAAKTLLAKVKMYQKEWDVVKRLTDEIIASGEYSLTPNYEDIWKESGENNSESIFEIQSRGGVPAVGVQQYSQIQGARGTGGWGWGFNVPSDDLVNSYEANDTRKDATIIFRGETLYDGRFVPNTVVNPRYNQKAYSSQYTSEAITGTNVRLFRYAEVLLMNAEAAFNLGGDASTSLNMLRRRAGLSEIAAPTIENIWNERRHELAMEGDRFFDLVRQGRARIVMRAVGKDFVDGKNEVFPIPQQEIEKSGGLLLQNPGY